VNKWGFDWGYSKAYIELLNVDTMITDYDTKTTDKKGKGAVTAENVAETLRVWEESQRLLKNKDNG